MLLFNRSSRGPEDEKEFVEKEERIENKELDDDDEQPAPLPVALKDVVSRAPELLTQAAALGQAATALVMEKPDQVINVAKTLAKTGKEGGELVSEERDTAANVVKRAQQGIAELGDMRENAPDNSKAAAKHAAAAAKDIAAGVSNPSVGKLAEGGAEGAKTTGNAAAVIAQSPGKAAAAVKDAVLAAANAVAVPLKNPKQAAKTAWEGARAGGAVAGLGLAAPKRTGRAASTLASAVTSIGGAASQALGVASRFPGGKVMYYAVLAVLLPWLLTAAVIGLVFGVSWEASVRAVQTTGACVSSAARVVAHRFRVTKEDLITSADAPAGDIDTHKELEARANSLMIPSATDALLTQRAREAEREHIASSPLHRFGRALGRVGRGIGGGIGKAAGYAAFWKRLDGTRATSPPPADLAFNTAMQPTLTDAAPDQVTAGEPPVPTHKQGLYGRARAYVDTLLTHRHRKAVFTPDGDLLPLLALGMKDGPYPLDKFMALWSSDETAHSTSTRGTYTTGGPKTPVLTTTTGAETVTPAYEVAKGASLGKPEDTSSVPAWNAPERSVIGGTAPGGVYRDGGVTSSPVTLRKVWAAVQAGVVALVDSGEAVYRAATEPGDRGAHALVRVERVGHLLMQPVVLAAAVGLAVVDTAMWFPYKIFSGMRRHHHERHHHLERKLAKQGYERVDSSSSSSSSSSSEGGSARGGSVSGTAPSFTMAPPATTTSVVPTTAAPLPSSAAPAETSPIPVTTFAPVTRIY